MTRRHLRPSAWTRPQQLAAAAYGLWSAVWTLIVGFVLLAPDRVARALRSEGYPPEFTQQVGGASSTAGTIGILVSTFVCLFIAFLSWRGVNRAFWPAMIYFTVTGLGAVWVPLRPAAHMGHDTLALVVHAFVNDFPGLIVGGWLVIGLIRTHHAWAQYRDEHNIDRTIRQPEA